MSSDFELGRTWFTGSVDCQSRMELIFNVTISVTLEISVVFFTLNVVLASVL